jgi:group I intron endonuclease
VKYKALLTINLAERLPKVQDAATGRFQKRPADYRNCGVYILRNLANGLIYVGASQRIRQRRRVHARTAKHHKNSRLQKDFRQYGLSNFVLEVIEWVAPAQLQEREQFWMNKLDSSNLAKGYNYGSAKSSQVGSGSRITRVQREQRRKTANKNWREGRFHRRASKVLRKKLSDSHMGIKRSLASRIKQSNTLRRRYGIKSTRS